MPTNDDPEVPRADDGRNAINVIAPAKGYLVKDYLTEQYAWFWDLRLGKAVPVDVHRLNRGRSAL